MIWLLILKNRFDKNEKNFNFEAFATKKEAEKAFKNHAEKHQKNYFRKIAKTVYNRNQTRYISDFAKYGKIFERPINESGSFSFSHYTVDHTAEIIADLVGLGIPRSQIKTGNDAPKGGKLGNFISCKYSKRCKFFKTTLPAILADWLNFEEVQK
jgi:hypothetical protein